MTSWNLPWTAHCRCERLVMRITEAPLLTFACHCTGCQRMSASAYSLTIMFPWAGFELVSGETVIGGLHGEHRHYYCAHCKTWAYTRPGGMDDYVNVRATMLDDHRWYTPFVEVCTEEGFAWARTGAKHSFAGVPPMEAFGAIAAEFAAIDWRPG